MLLGAKIEKCVTSAKSKADILRKNNVLTVKYYKKEKIASNVIKLLRWDLISWYVETIYMNTSYSGANIEQITVDS